CVDRWHFFVIVETDKSVNMVLFRSVVFCLLLPLSVAVTSDPAAAEPRSDIRILIDISGSMRWTDPDNLRQPGLRMLAGLLPADSRAGVWTFATEVNMLVPWRDVDQAWRDNAYQQSYKINSPGLFTNIEAVLETARINQTSADPAFRRSMILLSDGMVDISKDESKNRQSRQRVLEKVAPQLKQAGIVVHTIALSDEADHELLRDLSLITDGWYHQVNDAEELQRVFLLLFEKSAHRDSVPLTDNQFSIDDSVKEMTVLAFRTAGSEASVLVAPDQQKIVYPDLPENVRWQHEQYFDLVTIENPSAGRWLIDGEMDPDNRVLILTDMKLRTTDLPNNMLIGERFDFEASLTEKGEIIRRQDFLTLVDANLMQSHELGDFLDSELNSSQHDGVYSRQLGNFFQPGRNDVVMTVKSETFERERRQQINVVPLPVNIEATQIPQRSTRTHRINLEVDTAWLSTENLAISALLGAPDGSEWSYDVIKLDDELWQLTIAELDPGVTYNLQLQMRGQTPEGRSVFLQPARVLLEDEFDSVPLAEISTDIATTTPAEPVIDEPVHDSTVTSEKTSFFDNEMNLAMTKLAIGNLIILMLLGLAYWRWRKYQRDYVPAGEMI
uniref:VWA domain-containing protein n=1 Tax=Methylophaga lonarensis TaxID=999151 RepID=UPI003D2BD3C0